MAHLIHGGVFVTYASPAPDAPAARPSGLVGPDNDLAYAPWGDANNFPDQVYAAGKRNTVVGSTIDFQARALYGSGIAYGHVESYDAEGNEVFTRKYLPEVEDFLRGIGAARYFQKAAIDFYWTHNIFPELVLTRDRKRVAYISELSPRHTRYARMDTQGRVRFAFVRDWSRGADLDEAVRVPLFNPLDGDEALRSGKDPKVLYQTAYPTFGEDYYALAPWTSAMESGWLEYANNIPELKRNVINNQLNIKYHVQIADWWFRERFGDPWATMTPDQKQSAVRDLIDEFNRNMAGAKATSTAVVTTISTDRGQERSGWKITPIGNDAKMDGAHTEDGLSANQHLLYALGVPASLRGNAPGTAGMGAGSGSDVREHFNAYIQMCRMHEDVILEPLRFALRFSGIDPNLQLRVMRPSLKTQNQLTTSARTPNVNT